MSAGQLTFIVSLALLALTITGVNQCQKNYVFCPNCNVNPSSSPDDDDDDLTTTSTTSTTSTTENTTSTTETTTTTIPNTDTRPAVGFLQDLSRLSEVEKPAKEDSRPAPKRTPSKAQGKGDATWLGKAFTSDDEVAGQALDTDGDGYSDSLERQMGSSEKDAASQPATAPRTRLSDRLDGVDDDRDGVPNVEEEARSMKKNGVDTDSDGANDGAEILSKTNPMDNRSSPDDHDGDGLSSNYESSIGTDFNNPDTDDDGARDDVELALGMNPLENDSDHDGVLDGKELALGSDPTVAE